ncbi:hypothetical protein [Mesorhizobium sp. M0140]|uniref:hypothetical protein n=1 Tax=Mesorhizobium sp. M0140 TaxID=2956893 RepID=UPI00333779E7
MIRLVIILPIVFVAWMLLVKIISDVKKANVDWTGVTTIVGSSRWRFGCVTSPAWDEGEERE